MRKIDDFELSILVALCAGCLMVGALLGGIAAQSKRIQQTQYSQLTQTHPQFKLDPSEKIEHKLMVCENNENWAWFSILPVDPKLSNTGPVEIEIQSADKCLALRLQPDPVTHFVKVTASRPDGESKTFTVSGPVKVAVQKAGDTNGTK